jgi:hypothetical protein
MLFRIYRLAKNKAERGTNERSFVQVITTKKRWKQGLDAGTATP